MKRVENTIRDERMFGPGARVVAGVSGGPDSVALLSALLDLAPSWRLEITVAHLNHGLRANESDQDEKSVQELAKKLAVPLVTRKLDDRPQGNLEMALREVRYEFLLSVAKEKNAEYIAVGHHADDQAETVLINLIRGAGSAGLSGIAPARQAGPESEKYIVRPLIKVHRNEIIEYLGRAGLSWQEDSTNLDPAFLRNRIRHEIMPMLESLNPEIREALARTAGIARMEAEYIQEEALRALEKIGGHEDDIFALDLGPLREAMPGLRMAVYREAVRIATGSLRGISLAHLEAMDNLVINGPAHGALDLPGILVKREYESLHIGLAGESQGGPKGSELQEQTLPVPGSVEWRGPSSREYTIASEYASPPASAPDPAAEAWIDPQKVSAPLKVRSRRPGDRYRPAGMDGARKLKDIMNEMKIPPAERDLWPLVISDEEIIWVPGVRPAESAKPDLHGSHQLKLTINPQIPYSPQARSTGPGR